MAYCSCHGNNKAFADLKETMSDKACTIVKCYPYSNVWYPCIHYPGSFGHEKQPEESSSMTEGNYISTVSVCI